MFVEEQPKSGPSLLLILIPVALGFATLLAGIFYWTSRESAPASLEGVVRSPDPDYEWYSEHLELEGGDIKMGKNFAGHRVIIFSGVVNNNGERTVDVVEVKLTLFNYDEPVFETTRMPIKPGGYTPPIGPLSSRSFTLYLEDIPGNWLASHAEMELNGFRFKQDE